MDALARLADVISRHTSDNDHQPSAIEGVTISAASEPTDPRPGISEPTLAVVVQGGKRTVLGDGVFDYGRGQFLVVSLGLPLLGRITEASPVRPFLGFSVRLDQREIASIVLEAGLGLSDEPMRGIAVAAADDGLLDACARLVGLLDAPDDIPALAPLYQREILWRLLTGPQAGLVRQAGRVDGNVAQIIRTVHWMRDNYREPIRVAQLADHAGMSVSVFHRHFRSVTSLTPIQYQKAIRLQEARLILVEGPRNVAGVAHAVGYDSASQFSREYRRAFGSPPGRDAFRLRTVVNATAIP